MSDYKDAISQIRGLQLLLEAQRKNEDVSFDRYRAKLKNAGWLKTTFFELRDAAFKNRTGLANTYVFEVADLDIAKEALIQNDVQAGVSKLESIRDTFLKHSKNPGWLTGSAINFSANQVIKYEFQDYSKKVEQIIRSIR